MCHGLSHVHTAVGYRFNVMNTTNLIHTLLLLSLPLSLLFGFKASTCFVHHLSVFRRHYTNAVLVSVVCGCRCGLFEG
jgi:hypothetical protein